MTDVVKKRTRSAAKQAVYYRNYRRARERALVKLSQAYPEAYKALLELEKLRDEQTGAKWVDIDGTTVADLVAVSLADGEERADEFITEQGNYGGEA